MQTRDENYSRYLSKKLHKGHLNRRDFLYLGTLCVSSLSACAANPVTGKSQLMMVSEADEIAMDQSAAPRQFSADYGAVQDKALNAYITQLGNDLTRGSHRPAMPYNFRAVNATYINAYAFPAGSIAVTRGILLNLENEAELSGLLGHEIGHVNARHTAERMSKGGLVNMVVSGASTVMDVAGYGAFSPLAEGAGQLGGAVLLASYSRDDERQADELGMHYMVKAEQNPEGMVGLMSLLIEINKHTPSSMEAMFSSHPMSDERFNTAKTRAKESYVQFKARDKHRDRFMDHTVELRKLKPAINEMENGQSLMAQKKFSEAHKHFSKALKLAPEDYGALLLMAESQLNQEQYKEAEPYLAQARAVYPHEAKAMHLYGVSLLALKKHEQALTEFQAFQKALPVEPSAIFFQGLSYEGMGVQEKAANQYKLFLTKQSEGAQAKYAYQRLKEWKTL